MDKSSVEEYFAAFGKWGFLMAALVVGDVIGIAQSYARDWILPQWAWWLILVGILLLSPFIAFHKVRLERDKNKLDLDNIKNAKPVIHITHEIKGDQAYLKLNNSGGYAKVTARAKVVEGFNKIELYDMCWETAREMNKDDDSLILVGKIAGEALVLCKATASGTEQITETDPDLLKEYQQKRRYPTMYVGKSLLKDECVIEVLITSQPSSVEVLSPQRYIIGVDHEQEHKLLFMPLPESNPDKGGSQP